ncbi:MAG: prohead protease/major capsid protein fusion protein [Gemmatimonadaceae bacterium]
MHTRKQRLSGPELHRAIDASATITDAASRRFQLSFSSEIPYLRASYFDEPWIEVLGHGDGEIDMARIGSGNAPLLWGHDDFTRDNNIGVIEKAWVKDGRGYADVRMSMRSDLDGLMQDVTDGIVNNVSVGYQILERTLFKQNEDGPDEYRVTRWLPLEISLVSVPADDTVGVGRSATAQPNFTITNIEERKMAETTALQGNGERAADPAATPGDPAITKPPVAAAVPATVGDHAAEVAQRAVETALRNERARTTEIRSLAKTHNLSDDFVSKHEADGSTIEAARASALAELVKRDGGGQGPHITIGKEQAEKTRSAAEDWILARAGEKREGKTIDTNGNEFRGMTLMDLARDSLTRSGVNPRGLDSMEIAKRAITHSTSDFPIVLGNVFNKVLLNAYGVVPDTWRQFCAVGSVSDFRDSNRYRSGAFSDLSDIPEGGEYQYGTIGDAEFNPARVTTKGKMFSVTRQLLINDDLGAITNVLQLMGRSAARGIEKGVYALLALNSGAGPTMKDGNALFSVAHGNLAGTGAAPGVGSLAAESQAMQTQSFNGDFIDVPPSILLAPIAIAEAVKVLNASQFDPAVNKFQMPNQVRGMFATIIGTPRLTGTAYYLFADPNVEPVLEVDFLNGKQDPYTEQREGWNVDGIEYKIRHDWGANAVGFRGARKQPGA